MPAWEHLQSSSWPVAAKAREPDDILVQGNYWQGSPTLRGPGAGMAPDAHCRISGNTTVSGPEAVPATVVAAAGLEPAYQSLLQWVQVPPPAVP